MPRPTAQPNMVFDLAGMKSFDLTTYRQPYELMVDTLVEMPTKRRQPETVRLTGDWWFGVRRRN
jgi:hypothetical protein